MIEWTPALSTGVPLIDEHHRTIFQWLAELESAAAEERTLFGVYAITRLKHYARDHFAVEESMMTEAGYPDLAEHVAEHVAFRARLQELQLRSIGTDISSETVDFLRDWLTHHIAETDMAYVPWVRKLDAR
ncbi:MAG: bacteriohemerythrin [Rhodocyclaceae bacterium]|nr:bacteriohemerythrin [Rhodocyclaceae bacterium]